MNDSTSTLEAEPVPVGAEPISGWAGLLVPYDRPSVDGRVIRRPPGGPRWRELPLELKLQRTQAEGHDGAEIGLASITRVWEDDTGLWGSGQFDTADPRAQELARKVKDGYIGHVSVDLGDFTARHAQLGDRVVDEVTDWKLLSSTLVADAAMDGARVFVVDDPESVTPTAEVLAARRQAAGVFSGERLSLSFSATPTGCHGCQCSRTANGGQGEGSESSGATDNGTTSVQAANCAPEPKPAVALSRTESAAALSTLEEITMADKPAAPKTAPQQAGGDVDAIVTAVVEAVVAEMSKLLDEKLSDADKDKKKDSQAPADEQPTPAGALRSNIAMRMARATAAHATGKE